MDLQGRMRILVQIREETQARKECVAWGTPVSLAYL